MKAEIKRRIGHYIIKAGQHSVGKSIRLGMYDPKVPEELKAEVRKDGHGRRK